MAAHQAPPSLGFSRQEQWNGLLFPSPMHERKSESEVAQSCPTLSNHMNCILPGSSVHGIFQARVLEWGAIALGISYFLGSPDPDGYGRISLSISSSRWYCEAPVPTSAHSPGGSRISKGAVGLWGCLGAKHKAPSLWSHVKAQGALGVAWGSPP